jgi:NAD dependent epimerase/dehydratase family enzyme
MFLWSIERDDIEGIFNATGPDPVTNAEFMRQLRRRLNRPWSPPVPAWAVRIGAWSMGSEAELALTGRRCVPQRLLDMDFEFKYSNLEGALRDLQL